MGIMDKIKGLVGSNADKVAEGVDKATDVVDEKTAGKYHEPLEKIDEVAAEKLGEAAEESED